MNEKAEHTDLFGRPIKVDDYIVYSAVDGRSATMRVGQVIKLTLVKDKYSSTKPPVAKVLCKSWSNFKSGRLSPNPAAAKDPSGRQKNVTLGFLTRVVVVDPSTVSDKVKRDLAGPICDWMGNPIGGN